MAFDIIGDIHGCNDTLQALLQKLGYAVKDGVWSHPARKVIFLGDFIDRDLGQRNVIEIVRPMIEQGAAQAVMGNHEYNAIAWHTVVDGKPLRPNSEKNFRQHRAFLEAYPDDDERSEVIDWFKTLPLWLDTGELCVIHACWDPTLMLRIADTQQGSHLLGDELLFESSRKGSWQHTAIETLLKGKEISLPDGVIFHDKDGNPRNEIRVRFWDRTVMNYQEAFFGPEKFRTHIPEHPIEHDYVIDYDASLPPLFLGHYWLDSKPAPLASNIACVDYSVAKAGGRLVAYRWDGEQQLSNEKFVCVNRIEA